MAERMVVGVDFSGGGEDDAKENTWVTEGQFDDKKLTIDACRAISRNELTTFLKNLPDVSVAAMDFPFGIPQEFIQHLGIGAATMRDVWNGVTGNDKDADWFWSKGREVYSALGYEPKRAGDEYYSESLSPLNLRMYKMTFHGMRMLHTLWTESLCQVPPLKYPKRKGPVLLEVMPGAALKSFGLPHRGYKGGENPLENLEKILKDLPTISSVKLVNLHDFRDQCISKDHALDSIVATVVAALWASDESQLKRPGNNTVSKPKGKRKTPPGLLGKTELEAAKIEGWIYVPKNNPRG